MIIERESTLKSTFPPEQRRQIAIDPHIEIKTTSAGIDHSERRNKLFLFTVRLKALRSIIFAPAYKSLSKPEILPGMQSSKCVMAWRKRAIETI